MAPTIINITPGGYAANCYLVIKGTDAVLIDCTARAPDVQEALAEQGATLRGILLTHAHFDHMLTLDAVKREANVPVYLAAGDKDLPADGEKNAHTVFFGTPRSYPAPDVLFGDGETLSFGELALVSMLTPGHTRGSALFLCEGAAFTGDTIFAAGYGRFDLYGGDGAALVSSLERIATLPRDTVIYPGHGPHAELGAALDNLF
ncbi:MAG: MBL fold metallo-hydrolase [Ruminococcaceae bacterium]|nr:MBL fold metallo-hydrolase [Oscillospiraceae bacterium]